MIIEVKKGDRIKFVVPSIDQNTGIVRRVFINTVVVLLGGCEFLIKKSEITEVMK